ncbi:cupin domain-containing protein [Pseudomonas sp. 6D_7.1_Bac1]|uniref:(R)-mandelonitrile lyase n=1 Tax=Pseudomonas sp. 6D_7.1_Bac1 TaxID=2971615 RepID=UPI003965BE18
MKMFAATAIGLSLWAMNLNASDTPGVTVVANSTQASTEGAPEHFTGSVRVDAPFAGSPPSRIRGATVTFAPGARTAWHTHPLGQTLIVTEGTGLVQEAGKPAQLIKAGDTVRIAPNVKHWHGATATTGMTHIAITEALDNKTVDWLEQVGD